ncbi:MAG: hypothetical protein K2W95_16280 [Candidatus Obscuribacterales bacterium]|nr:hypothetical protein [Candidatus Obscuribacterales bacterium]
MKNNDATLRKKIIFEVIFSAAIALVGGALLLLLSIEQYRQTLSRGAEAQHPAFVIGGFSVSWSMLSVALCAAVSFTGTAISTHKLTKLAKTFSSNSL